MKNEETVLSFSISAATRQEVENHIDKTRMQLRKRGIAFSKKQMYEYIMQQSLKGFEMNNFINWLEKHEQED